MKLEFENDKLKVITFTFSDTDDDLEAFFDKLIEGLRQTYSDETEKVNSEGENSLFGKAESSGYRWDRVNGEVKTSLHLAMIQSEKMKTTVTLAIGVLEID